MKMTHSLLTLDLFEKMLPHDIEKILSHISWVERVLSKGKEILLSGNEIHTLMIITKGKMEGSVMSGNGRLLRIELLDAPKIIAPALIYGDTPGVLSVRAIEESIIQKLDKETFSLMLSEDRVLLTNFLRICANRFIFISRKLNIMSFHSIRKKLTLFLLEQAEIKGNPFYLKSSMTELADYMGVERPSLSTVFNGMMKEGLFCRTGKWVEIIKGEQLKKELD